MSRFTIEKAVRRGNKARVALAAPAGGGKTFTALTLAKELAESSDVLVIDTERGSASLYADQFEFQTMKWEPPYNPTELGQVIGEVGSAFSVVVVDSLSHFWMGEGGTLDMVDAASERAKGNKFAGWKTGTPAQNDMVDAMLRAPAHVIVTMRSKMEYVQEKDERGRVTIRRVGMAPVQRDGIEYEFTVTCDLDIEHKLMVAKTRCSLLADKVYRPGHAQEMGKVLHEWLDGAEADAATRPAVAVVPDPPPATAPPATDDDREKLRARIADLDERDRERVTAQWITAHLPPSGHEDFTKMHLAIASEMVDAIEVESFTRRRKHVSAKMNEVGVKTDEARHELMRHATDGRTESSKRLSRVETDAIVAYCQRIADLDTRAAS
jgi:hypothetical protein